MSLRALSGGVCFDCGGGRGRFVPIVAIWTLLSQDSQTGKFVFLSSWAVSLLLANDLYYVGRLHISLRRHAVFFTSFFPNLGKQNKGEKLIHYEAKWTDNKLRVMLEFEPRTSSTIHTRRRRSNKLSHEFAQVGFGRARDYKSVLRFLLGS